MKKDYFYSVFPQGFKKAESVIPTWPFCGLLLFALVFDPINRKRPLGILIRSRGGLELLRSIHGGDEHLQSRWWMMENMIKKNHMAQFYAASLIVQSI